MRVFAMAITLGMVGFCVALSPPLVMAQPPTPSSPAPQPSYPPQPAQAPQYPPQQYPQYPAQELPQYPQQPVPQYTPQQPQSPAYPSQPYPQPQSPQPPYSPYAQPAYGPAAYPLPPAEPVRPDLRYGMLIIAYMGAHIPIGDMADGNSSGFSMGGLLGGHIHPMFSINGELAIDFQNPKGANSEYSAALVDLSFSPLFHFGPPHLEIAVGPKLGFFAWGATTDVAASEGGYEYSATGLSYGMNAAIFVPITPKLSMGGMLSIRGYHTTQFCETRPYMSRYCEDVDSNDSDDSEILLAAGVRW